MSSSSQAPKRLRLFTLFNFGIIATLLAVWLGYKEYRLQLDHGNHHACERLKLGEEDPYWDRRVREALPAMEKTVARLMDLRAEGKLDDPQPNGRWKRAQHPVGFGCVKGTLEIPSTINSTLKHGLFGQSGTHSMLMRFSKAAFEPDFAPKMTAIAIKVFGVNGKRAMSFAERDGKIAAANKDTQDFIMITNPTLPLAAVPEEFIVLHEYLIKALYPGVVYWMLLNRPTLIPRVTMALLRGWKVNNPLLAPHYTVAPSKIGDGQAARLAVFPCSSDPQPSAGKSALKFKYIHEIIQDYLNNHDGCLKFMLQKQRDPCMDPVDDLIHEWTGPWEEVGTFRIPKGSKLDQGNTCDNTSFNPYHAVEENRPLGWVSRVRKEVYAMGSARRIEKNHDEQRQPEGVVTS